jgi:RNA-directed DNA polymerase
MNDSIDKDLLTAFTPQRVVQAFYRYKLAKWDRFSDLGDPDIFIPMGADGVTFEAFENQIERHARNICRRIQDDSYIFYPFRELEIEKEPATAEKPAKYRTLSIASIRDALVQTILYNDVLYEPIEALFSGLDTPEVVSFAYRKGQSAPAAAQAVYSHIQSGYWYVFDADLSKYFDTIPHDKLLDRLALVIGGNESKTYKLVRRFLHTDRVEHKSYKYKGRKGKYPGYKIFHWQKPQRTRRDMGVPQGGVLSGMLANLYLHDFDEWVVNELGRSIDLKYVRYADDFVILTRSPDDLKTIHHEVRDRIKSLDLQLNEDKTDKLDVREKGLDFVGFHFDSVHMRVRDRNVERYKNRIQSIVDALPEYIEDRDDPVTTLRWLSWRIKYKVQGLSGNELCPGCGQGRVGPPRSWMAFFQVVTDIEQLRELDKWTRRTVYDFMYRKYSVRVKRSDLHKVGFRSLVNERYRIPKSRLKPCLCEIEELGLWYFAKDIYEGKQFHTLARKRPFIVSRVDSNDLQVVVGGKRNLIARDTFIKLWDRLTRDKRISRAELEQEGIQSTSQIVTLISELPGVNTTLRPITLYFTDKKPADFLLPRVKKTK